MIEHKESRFKALAKQLADGMLANLSAPDEEADRLDEEAFQRSLKVKPLGSEQEVVEKPTVPPSPFAKRFGWYKTKDVGTCEPGQRSDLTGCTPASGTPSAKKPKKEKPAAQPSAPVKRPAQRGKLVGAKREGKGKEAKVVMDDGNPAPPHITPAMIPPAWSRVKVSMNPDADVLAVGKMKDKNGKWSNRTVYNAKYLANNQAAKFAKIAQGLTQFQEMHDQNQKNRSNPELKNAADCVWLMMEQATRPGSESDTKGLEKHYGKELTKDNFEIIRKTTGKKVKKQTTSVLLKVGDAKIPMRDEGTKQELIRRIENNEPLYDSTYWLKSHGATTLEGRHVVQAPDGVRLQFQGKESVWHDHLIKNPELAKMLLERKKRGEKEKLFGVDYDETAKYSHTLGNGGYGLKDFRTLKATRTAIEEIKSRPAPSAENYQQAVMDVATRVSGILGNRPQQALESYIAPEVWSAWQNPDVVVGQKSLRVKSSPFVYRTKAIEQQPKISEARGKPCEPGQSAELTGCIPAKPGQPQQQGQTQQQQAQPQAPPQQQPTVEQHVQAAEGMVDKLVGGSTEPAVAEPAQEPTAEVPPEQVPQEITLQNAADVFESMEDSQMTALLGVKTGKVKDKTKLDPGDFDFLHSLQRGDPKKKAMGVAVTIEHPHLEQCERFLGVDGNGEKFIYNNVLKIKQQYQKSGLGTHIFSNEVENAVKQGFNYIATEAAGSAGDKWNGYYTWPRLGYDETLESINRYNPDLVYKIQGKFPEAKSVLDIFETREGREWWKMNGKTLMDARFDLTEGSRSRTILNKYLEERKKQGV